MFMGLLCIILGSV